MKKSLMNRLLLSVLFVVCTFAQVVAGGGKQATFKVSGNCGMCERLIEGAATSLKGVKSASWSQETKALVVVYNEKLVKLDDIKAKIAAAGYDAEGKVASQEAYDGLPGCCKYDR